MSAILNRILTELWKADESFYRDPRVSHLPLIGSPWPMMCIIVVYILFVKRWGPRFMEKRPPFNVTNVMQAYNVLQIVLNFYVFVASNRYSYLQPHFKITCGDYNPQDTRPSYMNLRYPAYVYYLSKYLDLLDTVFFVLRKKYNQITLLHVYHHSIMIFGVWAYITLLFGSHFTMTGTLNSFIHVCMYSYYFLAALKLKSFDLSPWKRRLTQMQILQFAILLLYFIQLPLNNWCKLDMFWVWTTIANNILMLALFVNFYIRAYSKPQKKQK